MTGETDWVMGPLLSTLHDLAREARKRKTNYDTKSVNRDQVEKYQQQGWEFDKRLKTKTRIRRFKPLDERLENRVWTLFYKLGYPELNEGRNFQILIERKQAEPLKKQIDVYARDTETVIVAECKLSLIHI